MLAIVLPQNPPGAAPEGQSLNLVRKSKNYLLARVASL
jgi:hypothetical protein